MKLDTRTRLCDRKVMSSLFAKLSQPNFVSNEKKQTEEARPGQQSYVHKMELCLLEVWLQDQEIQAQPAEEHNKPAYKNVDDKMVVKLQVPEGRGKWWWEKQMEYFVEVEHFCLENTTQGEGNSEDTHL